MFSPGLFLTAAGVGLAVAAPVGPMGMLCIRRTLTDGPRAGLAIGFGIAGGDAQTGDVREHGRAHGGHAGGQNRRRRRKSLRHAL